MKRQNRKVVKRRAILQVSKMGFSGRIISGILLFGRLESNKSGILLNFSFLTVLDYLQCLFRWLLIFNFSILPEELEFL